ncbi:MAG TPA: hypothetical protein VIE36_09490 [Methylomirabilota bacterium]
MKTFAITLMVASFAAALPACDVTRSVVQAASSEPARAAPSRVTVTVQQLIDSGHRLELPAGSEVLWADAHFDRVWFPSSVNAPHVERTGLGYRAVFTTPGTYRGAFTIVGGHRSDDVYPLVVVVTDR